MARPAAGARDAGGQLGLGSLHRRLPAAASALPDLSGVSGSSSSLARERNEGGSVSGGRGLWVRWCERQDTRVSAAQN